MSFTKPSTKAFTIAFALVSFAGLAAAPAQAATRPVGITVDIFADRCAAQGGSFSDANPVFVCATAEVSVECGFFDLNNAQCEWAGIDNQIPVNRLIGMADAEALNNGSDGAAKKGGIKKLDLPIKWK